MRTTAQDLDSMAYDQPPYPLMPCRILLERGLTLREIQVLQLLPLGYTNKQIGCALEITEHTVKKN